jgi:hypothetical protein
MLVPAISFFFFFEVISFEMGEPAPLTPRSPSHVHFVIPSIPQTFHPNHFTCSLSKGVSKGEQMKPLPIPLARSTTAPAKAPLHQHPDYSLQHGSISTYRTSGNRCHYLPLSLSLKPSCQGTLNYFWNLCVQVVKLISIHPVLYEAHIN